MALALQSLAAGMRAGLRTHLDDEPTAAALQTQLQSVCTLVQAELAQSDRGHAWSRPRHIREVHILHDIRSEFDGIKWSMATI